MPRGGGGSSPPFTTPAPRSWYKPPHPVLDLESSFSHFWAVARNPRSRSSESFGWWRWKVGGDPRSFTAVAASPSMAAKGRHGYHGERHDGNGVDRAGRGTGRNPGRGNGRGGERSKFSWKRDVNGDHTNSASSNVAAASGGTSRWDEAAMQKHHVIQDGGTWVQKNQASSGLGGAGAGQQASTQQHEENIP